MQYAVSRVSRFTSHVKSSLLRTALRRIVCIAVTLAAGVAVLAVNLGTRRAESNSVLTWNIGGSSTSLFNFQDAHQLSVTFPGADRATQALQSGQAEPRSLASGDLDENGTPDLVAGYAFGGTGIVTIQHGNPDAFAPADESVFERLVQGYNPESLLPEAEVYPLPAPADFLAVGNFDNRSGKDILFAAKGGGLYLMAGDGSGQFGVPVQIALPGTISALATGEFCAADGLADVAVGINGAGGAALWIFDGVDGLSKPAIQYQLAEPAKAIEFGGLDDDPFQDAAVAVGKEIIVIHGRGRKTSNEQSADTNSRIERIAMPFQVRSLALGFFVWERKGRTQIAALGEDGSIHIHTRGKLDERPFSKEELAARSRGRIGARRQPADVESTPGWTTDWSEGWSPVREFKTSVAISSATDSQFQLLHSHLSFRELDNLVLLGENQNRVSLVTQAEHGDADVAAQSISGSDDMTTATLDLPDEPAAVLALPQKLNGERNIVVLQKKSTSPLVVIQAAFFYIVDFTGGGNNPFADGNDSATHGGTGSMADPFHMANLRGAVTAANANPGSTITLPAGTYILSINGGTVNGCDGNDTGDLAANQSMTITGAGAATTIIRQQGTGPGNDGDRVMCMNENFLLNLIYTFSGVTFTGGRDGTAAGGGTSIGGAGIIGGEKDNSLTLTNVTLSNNQETVSGSANLGGGGIQITGGDLIVTNCTIGGTNAPGAYTDRSTVANANSQAGSGGGITYTPSAPRHTASMGVLTVTGTTFSRNTAAGIGGGGADVLNFAFASPGSFGSGSASFATSTFSNNHATGVGGAIVNESLATTVASTSFNNNSADNRGGGIYVGGATLLLDGTNPSITFSGNTATNGGSSVSTASATTLQGTNTTIGGDIEISTLGSWTNTAGSIVAPTNVVMVGGTFNCNNSTTNISGNLSIDPGAIVGSTFNGDSGTVNIAGNMTINSGGSPATSFNAGTSTFNFNGSGAQSIGGSLSPTFNNLTDSNITQPLTINSNIAVGNTLNVNGANAILNPAVGINISGGGTLTGTGTARATRTPGDFLTQYTITNKTLTNLTIDYNGAGAQTVNNAPAYGHLRISNSGTKTLEGATSITGNLTIAAAVLDVSASNFGFNLDGNWTNSVGAAGFVARNGTVTFDGSGVVQALTGSTTFFNLTLNNTSSLTDFGSTTTTIQNNLVTSAGSMEGNLSTIIFTGAAGSISGANAKKFYNLQINSGASISNSTGGNTLILNDYTNNGTFSQAAALTTTFATSTLDGTHSLLGSGASTFGNITINGSNTVGQGTHNFNVVGASFNVPGTFTGNAGTVTFNGGVAQSITGDGAKNFFGLTSNNANGVTVADSTPTVDATVGGVLTLTTNLTVASGAILQQSGTSAGAADVIGTVRRTDMGVTARAFGNPNVTIAIDSGTPPNPMDVTLTKTAPAAFPTAVQRTYALTPTGGAGISATVKLHYLNAELNGNTETKLGLFKDVGGTFVVQGRTGAVDTANKAVTLSGVSSFSNWTLADMADVSVTVSPTSVLEDSGTAMVYTFTRTGATTAALTVNFSVTGTATPPGGATPDYSQTGAATFTTTDGTVTFTAGNSTATVNITPITDTTVEPDETAILTVTTGTTYNIGAPSVATGTITNDDADVSVAVSPTSVTEDGAPNLVYTFTRTGATAGAITVNFSIGGTATFNTDYTQTGAATFVPPSGTVAFSAGATTASITVDPTADNTVEPNETVILTVTAGTGYNVGTPSVATGTITNDDADVSVAVATSAGPGTSVPEDGATNLVYTFTRTGFTGAALTINFSVGGTATFSTDYTQTGAATFTTTTGTVTFTGTNTTATVTIDPSVDSTAEPDETVILTVTAGTGYSPAAPTSATGTILNDDTQVSVAASPTSVAEDGATNMVYTFTRTGDTSSALTVNFTVGGTATFNTDYTQTGAATFTASTGTVSIPIGQASAAVTIDPTADTTVEPDETVILTVAAGSGYVVGAPSSATGTITNDDTDVTVAVSPASVAEDGATNLVYTFTRTGVTTGALTVNFTVGGTATFNTDYTQTGAATFDGATGTVSFGAGSSTATVTVDPTTDTTVEPDETVILTVTAGTGYNVGVPNAATGTISNDDTDVTLAVSPSSVLEDGATNLVYTFTRTGVTSSPLTVNFTVGGTATFSTDYTQTGAATFTASTGTVTFGAGNSTATVTVDPSGDTTPEPDETVILTLASGTGYNVGAPNTATGTIVNDDTDVSVAVSPASVFEDGATNLVYTFTRVGITTGSLTINFSVGGTATFGSDYAQSGADTFTTSAGTVTFAAGSSTAMVTLDPTPDMTVEPDETAILTVVAGSGYNPAAPVSATGTITNDDTDVTVAVSPTSTPEDDAGNLVYTFTRSGVTTGAITVNFTVGGTATFNTDYTASGADTFTASSGTITIGSGSSTASVTVDPTTDTTVEPDETVILTLAAGTGYNIGVPNSATGTITNDDTDVTLTLSPSSVSEDGSAGLVYTFTRSGVTSTPLTVNFSVGGTATFTSDYTQTGAATFGASSGTVTITTGNTTATVTLTPVDDVLVEGSETTILTITAGSYGIGVPNTATGTITDNDTATISFATSASNAPEQTTPHNVGVTLVISATGSGTPMLGRTVTVNVQDLGTGSATGGGVDYTFSPNPTTITFSSGDIAQTKNAPVAIVNDNLSEGNETINFALNSLVDGTGGQVSLVAPTADTVTIVDNDIDLKVTKTESADPVAAGGGTGNLVYTVKIKNVGLTVATGVTASETITIPATGVTIDSVMVNGGSLSGTNPYAWTIGTLTVNQELTLTATLTVGAGAAAGTNVICDTATVTGSNENRVNTGDDSVTECTSIVAQADVEITSKTDSPDPACTQGNITYTISYKNNGPGPGLSAVVSDTVPANTTLVSASTGSAGWSRTDSVPVGGTGTVTFAKSSSPNGETGTFTIVVNISAGTLHGTVISNTASVSSSLADPTPGNNSKTAMTTVDTTPPTLTCPSNIAAVTNQNVCAQGGCVAVNYATPTAMDNCPGVQVVCVPPSGSCLPTGSSTVTCTATDTAGNTASCSFSVAVFDVCLQDDSNPNTVLLLNSLTGDFKFCCSGTTYTGTATMNVRGCVITFQQGVGTQKLLGQVDKTIFKGTATIQSPPGVTKCMITDRNIRNNSCSCQ